MVTLCAKGDLKRTFLFVTFVVMSAAQYENYNFRNFPEEELMPLTAAYGTALDNYAAGNWTGSIQYLELSLRLHRLLRDSVRHCALHCNRSKHDGPSFTGDPELRVHWHVMMRASCQKRCRASFPGLRLPPPGKKILDDFDRRSPYRYLHFAHSELNNLQKAVPCAYTFLQRNPEDQEMQQLMEEYKSQYDLSGFLIDHEQRPYEASFLSGVKLVSSGDYSSGVELLEEALRLYLQEYDLCEADCEGLIGHLLADGDFYAVVADVYIDVLRCKLKCEEHLKPSVGGYFVERFVPNLYHYLQFAYYKLNDGVRAVPCAHSYFLFEPDDQIMKQNLLYYKAYSQQWGLRSDHFTPRREAFEHYNQTFTQKQMLAFAETYLELDDEDFFGPEEAAFLASGSPDLEFEGMGDYEESFFANWRQPRDKGDVGQSHL
ncbi:endoplasmic reticulum protein SC65-like [Mugil cephalus]|uniref:endoplasmic reticulum protein SC65-like n=1 Tax=Mugil cephalus TaxID=48193 RepID=UPI001FB7CA7A|nr:endoplasmic reticulum protein SC65-like [Mugil cephalus]